MPDPENPTSGTGFDPASVRYDAATGLAPVIAQDARTGEVLMLGYATAEALERSLESGQLTFHSRSRDRLWTKGETSGNTLAVVSLHADCDSDAVLARVVPAGPACHTGDRSCFSAPPTLPALADTLRQRQATMERPAAEHGSYTARLLSDRNLRLKKLGEEAVELATACADGDTDRVREEAADLVYHALVACMGAGVEPESVLEVLEARRG
ncbi:MAG TPA: bifunctional phosphoribosyl-AMP cyclohydrolase/phosphoribosyl-ATP diphosphatase HisIE [Longimicrobiales bacterium]|nr:bifunctional phosphoribosyl-AMP cyclohydrolase/phosphoribosyl-ATP diphosphatase HisIE [Longimicrobiales bacterium]